MTILMIIAVCLALVGGLISLFTLIWLLCSERGRAVLDLLLPKYERRCADCDGCSFCKAAFKGVPFPCSGFKRIEE